MDQLRALAEADDVFIDGLERGDGRRYAFPVMGLPPTLCPSRWRFGCTFGLRNRRGLGRLGPGRHCAGIASYPVLAVTLVTIHTPTLRYAVALIFAESSAIAG